MSTDQQPGSSPEHTDGTLAQYHVGGGRHAPRSRKGCWTCRKSKVKCNEDQPVCGRCYRLALVCDYTPKPKLAERRRQQAGGQSKMGTQVLSTGDNDLSDAEVIPERQLFEVSFLRSQRNSLSTLALTDLSTGACSLTLGVGDHEAIRYFRTAFAKSNHTKNPNFSLFSIMFNIAQYDPMVMHLVIAMGLREMDIRRPDQVGSRTPSPVHHYSSALRLMADAIGKQPESQDLDAIHTALWLMLLYEQKFGDARGQGVSNHLTGASLFLQHRGKDLMRLPAPCPGSTEKASALAKRSANEFSSQLSLYSARMLVWIAIQDAAAASAGIGGQVSGTLFGMLSEAIPDTGYGMATPIDTFSRLHRYSNPLYRTMWGDSYPQAELLDDVENRNIFALLGHTSQLRFMIAQLATLYQVDLEAAKLKAQAVDRAIYQVGYTFNELMDVASELSLETDNSHRLVSNIRAIVPQYYASVLEFLRLTMFDQPLGNRQRHALREIMNLAFQTFKHDGEEAMCRISWPLFIAAMETDDLLHRDWILQRYSAIRKLGQNYRRAHDFLVDNLTLQDQLGQRIGIREAMRNREQYFVLGV